MVAARGTAPIYQRIAAELRGRIEDGDLAPGAKLPTEHDLAAEHGVTRATARQAVQLLVNEGLVVSERPRGHFVRRTERQVYRPQREWRHHPTYPQLRQVATGEVEPDGDRSSRTLAVELAAAPPDVADRLGLADGDTVVVRRRTHSVDGMPVRTEDAFFPLDLVAGSDILQPADTGREANEVLAGLGVEQDHAVDEIEVRMPTPEEASRLEIGLGVPVALHRITGYTVDDRPVRVVRSVLPGDRHVIVFERARRRRRSAGDSR